MGSNIIYIDWRDCDYQDLNSFGTGYNTADIIIRWNAGTSHFEHRDHYNGTTWYGISQDSTVGIWDGNRKNNTIPAYDHFQPTIPHNLTYTPNNNHPELMWNASEQFNGNVTYIIRRKNPNQSTFAIIASGITETTFIDTDVTLCCGSQIVTYQFTVEAVSGDGQNYSGECGQIYVTVKEGNFAKKEIVEIFPNEFSLKIFPNPFNPATTINFSIPEESLMKIAIYDLKGKKVKIFKSDYFESGYHFIKWDGKDENNNPLSSGLYIINITAQYLESNTYFARSNKLILLK